VNATANNRRYYVKQANCAAVNGCSTNRGTDPWPQTNRTEFTDSSTPNSRSWAGVNTNKPITGIVHNITARTVSFLFMGGGDPMWGIALNQKGAYTFDDAEYEYGNQTPLTVTVSNTGNQPTGALDIALSGTHADAFTLSTPSIDNISFGLDARFTIAPNLDLSWGTYTATVTVTGNHSLLGTFDVSFRVAPPVNIRDFVETGHAPSLQAWFTNGVLHIKGLTIGQIYRIYNISGTLVHQGVATADVETWRAASLQPSGIYIIQSENKSVKIIKR
jgi:hypothetical protein